MCAKIAAAATIIVAVIGGLAVWLAPFGGTQGLAFADVQKELGRIENVTLKFTEQFPGRPDNVFRMMITQSGMTRVEWANGNVLIVNPKQGRSLELKAKEKRAVIKQAFPLRELNLLAELRGRQKDPIEKLPEREIDGNRGA